jgi:hypothetical protein
VVFFGAAGCGVETTVLFGGGFSTVHPLTHAASAAAITATAAGLLIVLEYIPYPPEGNYHSEP